MVYFLVTRFLNKHSICNEIVSVVSFHRNDKNSKQKEKSLPNNIFKRRFQVANA